jgi:pSer/pThr/pTyr-binding forkhead associated (FHA) protein
MNAPAQLPVLRGMSAQVKDQRIEIAESLSLGSVDAADVCLTGDDVAADHARLRWHEQTLTIERRDGSAEVYVNGKPVARQQLTAGDELRIGQHRFVVKMPALRPHSVLRDVPAEKPVSSLRWWLFAASLAAASAAAYWYFSTLN